MLSSDLLLAKSMDTLINVVIPVFGLILTGYLAGRFDVLGPDSAAALTRFVYYFAFPAALFVFSARAPIDKIFNWPFIWAFVCGSLSTFFIAVIVGRLWFGHDMATLSVVGFTAIFGNVIGIGLPLLLTAYGPDGALPPIVVALVFSVLFISSVIAVLEGTQTSGPSALRVAAQLTGTLLRNPVVVSPVLGIIYSMTALPLPRAVSNYLDLMAGAVGPAALFAVGLSLVGRKLAGDVREVIWLSLIKAVINPIIAFLLVTYVFVMEPFWSQAAVVLSAMPVGTNPYVIAQQYNVHVKTVSPTIVVSTAMSVITIFLVLLYYGVG
jgi:malonate transporter and related proteins